MFYNDFETEALIRIYDKVLGTEASMHPDEMRKLEMHIRERREMVRTGVARCPTWFQEELNRLDSKMRAWWDSWKEEWVLDRLQEEGFYLTVVHFQPKGELQLDRSLIELLRKNDLQRYSDPKEYVRQVRERAAAKQQANEAAATDKVLAAVDKMSSKQIEDFIAVETAIQNGETITAHGPDAKFLEQAASDKSRALKDAEAQGKRLVIDNTDAAINPGMDPRIYKRRRPKKNNKELIFS